MIYISHDLLKSRIQSIGTTHMFMLPETQTYMYVSDATDHIPNSEIAMTLL